jgi:hypothetical protein
VNTVLLPRPVDIGNDPDEVDHLYCPCTPDLALCGVDVSEEPEHDVPVNPVCGLCLLLDNADYQCAGCGQ